MEINQPQLLEQIEQARSGRQSAFRFLLDTFWNEVYAFQLKRTKNEYSAEEITIQTFSRAFDRLETFDQSYNFKTWLITISKNIHIDLIRKKKASIQANSADEEDERYYGIADETPSIEDTLIKEQNLAALLRDIKQLNPSYQEVINLRYFQEKSYKQIASELDESMSNVKVKLLRAKKILAQIIRNREE